MTDEITNSQDIIDIRDVIEVYESLTNEIDDVKNGESKQAETMSIGEWIDGLNVEAHPLCDAIQQYQTMQALLEECRGRGGDHQYQGDWYPATLIADDYFEDYAQELAEDCGDIPKESRWPLYCIDWEQAARALQMDYTSVDFDGSTYWIR